MPDRTDSVNELDLQSIEEYAVSFSRLASLGLLSSAIMHDVRNALTVLSGNIQILLLKIGRLEPDELRERLERIMPQIERIERIINRVESFSRRAEGATRTFDPLSAVRNALYEIGTDNFDGQSLIENLPQLSKRIHCDSSLLEFVIVELMRQALPRINVGELRIHSSDHHPYWEFRLEWSESVDSGRTTAGADTGLMLCRVAMQRMGGELTPVSEPEMVGWRLLLPWRIELEEEAAD